MRNFRLYYEVVHEFQNNVFEKNSGIVLGSRKKNGIITPYDPDITTHCGKILCLMKKNKRYACGASRENFINKKNLVELIEIHFLNNRQLKQF